MTMKKKWRRIAYLLATILFLIFTLGPFLWTFLLSITPDSAMFEANKDFLPREITWNHYLQLFGGSRRGRTFFHGIQNSLRAVVVTLLIGLPISLMSAYALSRLEFWGRKLIKNLLLITMVIPVMATIIPLYRMFAVGQMLDQTFWLCVIYVSSYLPMVTWLISNYLSAIPRELEEAAYIDGCGRFQAFMRILLPLSMPILLSAALIMFLNTWSQFQIPLILASSMNTKPMAIVISEFVTKDSIEYGLVAAAGILALLPPAVTAFIFRKFLISGMISGSVKN